MRRLVLLFKLAFVTFLYGARFFSLGDKETVREWCRKMLKLMGVRVIVRGRVPYKPCVIVSNHKSYIDPLVLTSILPDYPVWVVKREVARWPFIGRGLRKYGAVFVDRANPRKAAMSVLRFFSGMGMKRSVAIFPEGTRGEVGKLKKGAFVLAKKLGFPLLPVRLWNTASILRPGLVIPNPGVVYVEIFDPIPPGKPVEEAMRITEDLLL